MNIKTKEDIIKLILEKSDTYIKDYLPKNSLEKDIYLTSRKMNLDWDFPIANINEVQKIRKKINNDFKTMEDKKERKLLNDFVTTIVGNGLPKNSYYSNADFGFDFKKNNFEIFIDGKEFKEPILCIGTDEDYDYFVMSPAFKGVRKVFHDMDGEIININYNNINDFAQTVLKFSIIEGSIKKGLLKKEDLEYCIDNIKNEKLKDLIKDRTLSL